MTQFITKEQSINKAKEVICVLTANRSSDITTLVQMQERLAGVLEFVSAVFPLTAKEWNELESYKNTRLEHWQKNQ